MNTKRVNAAAGVILAAQKQRNTAAGIAMALESAGLLQSPESAAELEQLRARVAELETAREALATRLKVGQRWQQGRTPALVSQNFVSQDELRAMFGIPLIAPWDEDPCRPCGCPKRFDRHADGCPAQAASVEDPHDSPLHHTYAVPRDLPEVCGCGHTARTHRPGGCIADAIHSGLIGLCGCTAEVTA